jgi:hypothetical protein
MRKDSSKPQIPVRKLPPRDSVITLAPGQGVTLNAKSDLEWKQKTRNLREIRGYILAECFSVEFQLDRLICEIFFPGLETVGATIHDDPQIRQRRDLFDEFFLKRARLNFAAKIELIKSLSSKKTDLARFIDANLIRKLGHLRDIRNKFAHYPISFFPETTEGQQTLVPKLVCRDDDLRLDEAFFSDLNKEFAAVAVALRSALSQLQIVEEGQGSEPPQSA